MESQDFKEYLTEKTDLMLSLIKEHVNKAILKVHRASEDEIICDIIYGKRVYKNLTFEVVDTGDNPNAHDEPWCYTYECDVDRDKLDNTTYVAGNQVKFSLTGEFYGHPMTDMQFAEAKYLEIER